MRISLAITTIFALSLSANALSAKAPPKPAENSEFISFEKDVMRDSYFAKAQCETYVKQLALPEQGVLKSISRTFIAEDNLLYITGAGSTASEDFEKLFSPAGYVISPELQRAKDKLDTGKGFIASFSSEFYSEQKVREAVVARKAIESNYAKDSEQQRNVTRYIFCRIAENLIGKGEDANIYQDYVAYSDSRVQEADIGYFKISADSSYYGKSVKTGNRYAEPKQWDGSRFFVIRASFKNLDTESRLPAEGSLFINYNGKDYEFDSVEPIMLEGYNIWFKKINPLITMKTKIVYRIPDEIHGEVFWRPGRNSNSTKLWLGSISAAKSD